jgi:hypothetical protein
VVATHSAVIVEFDSGRSFALIVTLLMLMMRGKLLIESKNAPRL